MLLPHLHDSPHFPPGHIEDSPTERSDHPHAHHQSHGNVISLVWSRSVDRPWILLVGHRAKPHLRLETRQDVEVEVYTAICLVMGRHCAVKARWETGAGVWATAKLARSPGRHDLLDTNLVRACMLLNEGGPKSVVLYEQRMRGGHAKI